MSPIPRTFLIVIVSLLLSSPVWADESPQSQLLNTMIRKGTCSTSDDWCPTSAKETENGFILNGKANFPVQWIALKGANLEAPCQLWSLGGGKENTVAVLLLTDSLGEVVWISRICPRVQ